MSFKFTFREITPEDTEILRMLKLRNAKPEEHICCEILRGDGITMKTWYSKADVALWGEDYIKANSKMKYIDGDWTVSLDTLHAFLRAVVVPEMQIKLKQGFGRAIRTETDTCVVAILDERAAKDQRYWKDVLTTLPEMPITQDLHQVEAFIRGVKPDSYFQERTA